MSLPAEPGRSPIDPTDESLHPERSEPAGAEPGPATNAGAGERGGELVQIIGSRSLLVDVHLLGGRD